MAPVQHTGAFVVLGVQAMFPIMLGSFKSLRTPAAVKARRRRARQLDRTRLLDDEDEEEDEVESISLTDSLLFPIMASAMLIGLWYLIKYVDKIWIDLVFGVYFSLASVLAVHATFSSIFDGILRILGVKGKTYHVRISSGLKQIFHLPLRLQHLFAGPLAAVLPAAYVPLGRPYILTNILATCLATAALAFLRLDGFPTAAALLGLLLVYDIFWVFYTPVMVTVAKGIDGPIKLLAPKPDSSFAMLGLGDVVIPGLMIALCLRFDFARHVAKNPGKDVSPRDSFGKGYFVTAILSYIAGLVTTIYAMHVQNRAQPALLYLSPACTLGPLALALVRGELGLLWGWREDDEEEERDDTIEPPSAVAQMARKKAKEIEESLQAEIKASEVEAKPAEVQDDSWMEPEPVVEKPKKRRTKKK